MMPLIHIPCHSFSVAVVNSRPAFGFLMKQQVEKKNQTPDNGLITPG